jgi:nicotinamidase/pyrazinamidase
MQGGRMPEYDESTGLLVVDVQNDFADPQGGLYVSGGEKTIDFINDQIRGARGAGAVVAFTQDWHPESTPHFEKDGGIWPVHCVAGTWGAELHPGLDSEGPHVRKGSGGEDGYSGFTVRDPVSGREDTTDLRGILEDRRISKVVVVGLATDYCVKHTVLDARSLGYEATVLRDGIRAVDLEDGDGDKALSEMEGAGARIE